MTDLEEMALRYIVCPRCGARPGERCVTTGGAVSSRLHSPRPRPLYIVWKHAYREGRDDAKSG